MLTTGGRAWVHKRPAVLSRTEVEALLGKIEPPVCRMVVMTAQGAGLRISEVLALETGDIRGKAGIIHVRRGKGGTFPPGDAPATPARRPARVRAIGTPTVTDLGVGVG